MASIISLTDPLQGGPPITCMSDRIWNIRSVITIDPIPYNSPMSAHGFRGAVVLGGHVCAYNTL